MPKNPLMSDPAMQAMQKALVGVKKQKPMKPPKARVRARADFSNKGVK